MDGGSGELDTERMEKFEYGVVARLGPRRKRLVEAFAPKTCILGELCHASGARLVGTIKRGEFGRLPAVRTGGYRVSHDLLQHAASAQVHP